jgi:membrane protease YdiL (CAAX protease family)
VVLAPFLEELLFRSALFAPLRKFGRALAYSVSTLLFAFLHIASVVTAVLFFQMPAPPNLFLVMLLYIPAGIALCWAYDESGSVWTAIFLHALMNLVAVLLGSVLVFAHL